MPGWLSRLRRRRALDGPVLEGLDDTARAAVELQKAYWRHDPDRVAALTSGPIDELEWADALRLHHQWSLLALGARGDDGRLDASLGDPEFGIPESHAELLARLQSPASPYRARHAFAWKGRAAPEGEDIPYSTWQGRLANTAATHVGALEVLALDASHAPVAVEFVPFDALVTISMAPTRGFRPARLVREYGQPERIVLVPERYGLTWRCYEAELLRGEATRFVGIAPEGVDPRPDGLAAFGAQRLRLRSDFVDEGSPSFALGDVYQISFAMDVDDPRFVDKCEGRGIDPDETRAEVRSETDAKRRVRLRTLR